jgi:hypothetical protein
MHLGNAIVSVTWRCYLALFQSLKFCKLWRCFLQTSSLREFELAPKSLAKNPTKSRVHSPRVIWRSMWPGSRNPALKGVSSWRFQNFGSSKLWDVKFHDSQSYPNYQSNKSRRWLKNLTTKMNASRLSGGESIPVVRSTQMPTRVNEVNTSCSIKSMVGSHFKAWSWN